MESNLGKIDHEAFKSLIFGKTGSARSELFCGPAFGVDVSVVDLGDGRGLISSSDPLSLIPSLGLEESAFLSVHLIANDVATSGFAPQFGQFVLNLPASMSRSDFSEYWHYIDRFCREIGMSISGGHTGFIPGLESTISGGGTFSAVAPLDEIKLSKNAKAGQTILVTKKAAMSATALLAMSFPQEVKRQLGQEVYVSAASEFSRLSVLDEAQIARKTGVVSAMHNVTEGGILGALYELAVASNLGIEIQNEKLPIGQAQKEVCRLFDLDPRAVIGEGCMLIATEAGKEQVVIDALQAHEIPCTAVGKITEKGKGLKLISEEQMYDLPYTEKDPYWAAYFGALKRGWK
ncbi:AIR synthase family protein [Marinilongibacter aquaticus]|uniref:AIR synthase family protein n=1 Tax=Marinilongibacter aquaticus TaxID=2975157 RepID=UPI0021BCFE84|nr:AIR synthase family protein [Marinilongibacter aquaticus]UBM60576.1 AIR synthase family protein [Marinilongibacter aquaticus]